MILEKRLKELENENLRLREELKKTQKNINNQISGAIHASNKLYLESERLKTIVDNLSVGLIFIDRNGEKVETYNKAAMNLHGFKNESEFLLQFSDYAEQFQVLNDKGDEVPAEEWIIPKAVRGKFLRNWEVKLICRKTGRARHINFSAFPIHDADGNLINILLQMVDINQNKRTEEALRRSEERWNLAIEHLSVGAIIASEDEQLIFWNHAARKIHGFKDPNEGLGPLNQAPGTFELWTLDCKYRLEFDEWPMRRIKRGEKIQHYELRLRRPDQDWEKIVAYSGSMVETADGEKLIFLSVHDLTEQRKSEKALRDNEQLLQNVLEVLPVGVFISDDKGNLKLTNPAAEKIWGGKRLVPLENLHEYRGWWRGTGERLKAEDWAFARAFLKGETSVNEEIDIECFDGTKKTILNFCAPVKDQEGKILAAVAAAMDITERIKAEEALKKSESTLNAIIDTIPVGILIANDKGKIIRHNEAAADLWGLPPETNSWEKYKYWIGWWPETGERIKAEEWGMARALLHGENVKNELVQNQKFESEERKYFLNNAAPLLTSDGKIIGGVVAMLDVTESIKAKEALWQSEERFRTMADNIFQLAWMADEKGWIFWYNKRWFDYTGTSLEEMQGWGWKKVHHPDHVDRVVEKIKHSFETGQLWEDLFPLRGKDGKYRWFLSRAVPIKDKQGNLVRWFGTNTDVTEQRRSEVKLKKANDLFENILYILAHDLKGPIANMHMAANLIKSIDDMSRKIKLIDMYKPQLERMDNTIKGVTGILQVQKTEQSSAVLINMDAFIQEILTELRDDLKPNELSWNFRKKRQIKYIEPFLLSILRNLLTNAIKYRRKDVDLQIEISTESKREYTLLRVEDNGTGIDLNKHKNELFTPFMRIAPKESEGTGIGLYIIKTIVEKNGGYIEVESTPGEGTAFNCYLKEYD